MLESFAARRPCVTTDVGCCRELLEGKEEDVYGKAGYYVAPMYRDGLALAMEKMCESRSRRLRMGEKMDRRGVKGLLQTGTHDPSVPGAL